MRDLYKRKVADIHTPCSKGRAWMKWAHPICILPANAVRRLVIPSSMLGTIVNEFEVEKGWAQGKLIYFT
jgi:hypothetical protein